MNKKRFLITFAAENEEKLSFCITFFNRKNLFLRIFLYFSPQKKERTSKIRYIKVFRLRGI